MTPFVVSVDLLVYATTGTAAEIEARMLLAGLIEDGQLAGAAVGGTEPVDEAIALDLKGTRA
jgi:hypothetical protein